MLLVRLKATMRETRNPECQSAHEIELRYPFTSLWLLKGRSILSFDLLQSLHINVGSSSLQRHERSLGKIQRIFWEGKSRTTCKMSKHMVGQTKETYDVIGRLEMRFFFLQTLMFSFFKKKKKQKKGKEGCSHILLVKAIRIFQFSY